ncbi:MAG: tetratricopeptide repeat protein [bacterium]
MVLVAAAALVVAIALLIGLLVDEQDESADSLRGPLVSSVTGTTDRLTDGEALTEPTVAPTADRIQPSGEQWASLLPRLREIAAADPADVNAQRKLALAYYNLGRLDEAAAVYERLLANKEDPVLRNRLGNTLRDQGDVTGADAAYRQAISDDPTRAPPYLNLAELLWRQGRDKEALATIDQGLESVPEESRAALEKGREVLEASAP